MGSNSSNPGIVQRGKLPSFTPIQPVFNGHGRHQILIYDSRSYPGRRREFSYKTRFTNQSGLTTVYYRCMACRAIRQQLQRTSPTPLLPAVPCIAVKNDLLINDPDFPEASDHFCTPPTIDESNQRLRSIEEGKKCLLEGMVDGREWASVEFSENVTKSEPGNEIRIEGHQEREISMENKQQEIEGSICIDFDQMNLSDFEFDKFEDNGNEGTEEIEKITVELVELKKEMEAIKLSSKMILNEIAKKLDMKMDHLEKYFENKIIELIEKKKMDEYGGKVGKNGGGNFNL